MDATRPRAHRPRTGEEEEDEDADVDATRPPETGEGEEDEDVVVVVVPAHIGCSVSFKFFPQIWGNRRNPWNSMWAPLQYGIFSFI